MTKLAALIALLLLPVTVSAIPALIFDTTPGGAGGTMTYDGAGGPLIANDIAFVIIQGVNTPLNAGATLTCVNCLLDFETGANIQEGPGQFWTWAGGGSFILTGDVPALGLVGAPLLAGDFTEVINTPGLASSDSSALFIALGTDTKNETLASFFGLGPDFRFANTEIALGTFTLGLDGAFSAVPNQADIINTAVVSSPMSVLLLGLGLVMVRFIRA